MTLKKTLHDFVRLLLEEAEKNPEFAHRLKIVFGMQDKAEAINLIHQSNVGGRPKNRRPPPVLDPVEIANAGETALRERLSLLSIEQLRDIVAEFGMDPGKLVIKWKSAEKIIDRIVEVSTKRSQKGDAFRRD